MYAVTTTPYCCLEEITNENKTHIHVLNIDLERVHS